MKTMSNRLVPVGLTGLLFCQGVAASLYTKVDLNINEQQLDPPGPNQTIFVDQQQSSSSDGSPVGVSINPSVPYVDPSAAARARAGVLRAAVNAEANIPGSSYYSSSGRATARWTAEPVIKVDGVADGETGVIRGRMRFEGQLAYQNNGYGSGTQYVGGGFISLNMAANGAAGAASSAYTASYIDRITDNNVDRWFRVIANRSGTPTYVAVDTRPPGTRETFQIGEYLEVEITFQTGAPFQLTATLTADGSAAVGSSGRLDWDSAALNTAVWDGFQEVLIGGSMYSEFTAIDQLSGLDLAQAIPEEGLGDIDGNGTADALTDGLLTIRHLFGFSGATLTEGAVGDGCTRCGGTAIADQIESIRAQLDIDGNGITDALTDGLLVIRYLFGFRGDTLSNGAVGEGCSRCDAARIETYCATLMP